VSTISFFEFYRAAMPMFVPSVTLLRRWVIEHGIMWERIYGTPKRQVSDADDVFAVAAALFCDDGPPLYTHLSYR